jgi:hypothetical protein
MIQSRFFPVTPTDHRRHNKFIILSHISNFVPTTHAFPPDLRNRTEHYCFNEIKSFYRERMEKKQMPFHYYASKIRKDWELMVAAPQTYRSPIVAAAAQEYYIEDRFKDAIFVCVQDNFSLNIPDERLYQLLGSQLIEPLMNQFRVNFRDSVFWWDEIFNWEKYEQDKLTDPLGMRYPYETSRMRYFDRVIFNLETIKFL